MTKFAQHRARLRVLHRLPAGAAQAKTLSPVASAEHV